MATSPLCRSRPLRPVTAPLGLSCARAGKGPVLKGALHHHRRAPLLKSCHAAAADLPSEGEGSSNSKNGASEEPNTLPAPEESNTPPSSPGIFGRIKKFFIGDGLTMDKLRDMGLGAILSYGFVSNVNSGAFVVTAWIISVQKTGLCPLAPGQWKGYLTIYAGLWAIQNLMRPLRITAAITMLPLWEGFLKKIMDRFSMKKRSAFFLALFGLAMFTITSMALTLFVLGGLPPRAPMSLPA